jgi:hypothetical protein
VAVAAKGRDSRVMTSQPGRSFRSMIASLRKVENRGGGMGDRAVYRMSCPWSISARPPTVLHVGWLLGTPNRIRLAILSLEMQPLEPESGLPPAFMSKSGATFASTGFQPLGRCTSRPNAKSARQPRILGRFG